MSYAKSLTLGQFSTLFPLVLAIAPWTARYAPAHGPRVMVWADVDLEHPEPPREARL